MELHIKNLPYGKPIFRISTIQEPILKGEKDINDAALTLTPVVYPTHAVWLPGITSYEAAMKVSGLLKDAFRKFVESALKDAEGSRNAAFEVEGDDLLMRKLKLQAAFDLMYGIANGGGWPRAEIMSVLPDANRRNDYIKQMCDFAFHDEISRITNALRVLPNWGGKLPGTEIMSAWEDANIFDKDAVGSINAAVRPIPSFVDVHGGGRSRDWPWLYKLGGANGIINDDDEYCWGGKDIESHGAITEDSFKNAGYPKLAKVFLGLSAEKAVFMFASSPSSPEMPPLFYFSMICDVLTVFTSLAAIYMEPKKPKASAILGNIAGCSFVLSFLAMMAKFLA